MPNVLITPSALSRMTVAILDAYLGQAVTPAMRRMAERLGCDVGRILVEAGCIPPDPDTKAH